MSNQHEESEEDHSQEQGSEQPRDNKGRFSPKSQTDSRGQSQPHDSEYTKINSILAKQLGITDKLADYQTKYDPRDLFKMLEFMVENTENTNGRQPNSGVRPPNEPIVPISPEQSKIDLPGIQWLEKPNLSQNKFSASFKISPSHLLKSKDKQ